MFLERLSVTGISSSPYYVQGGEFNTTVGGDLQMPNCTMYCFCRGYESVDATERFP